MALKEAKIWPRWRVTISQDGRFIFERPEDWERFKIPYYGREMELILKDRAKDRSRQEEKYYHAVVVRMVAEAMEIGRQEAHEFLKRLFLTIEDKTTSGIRYRRSMSTTELSDKAYRDYWERVILWAAQPTEDRGLDESSGLDLVIPYPNEVFYNEAT